MTQTAQRQQTNHAPPGAIAGHNDLVEAAGAPVGGGNIKPGYDSRLTNEDLAPLRKQTWSSYNIFAWRAARWAGADRDR